MNRYQHESSPEIHKRKNNEAFFHIKGGHPVTVAIPTWVKSFEYDYDGISCCYGIFLEVEGTVHE
jgi:hypothetical protein